MTAPDPPIEEQFPPPPPTPELPSELTSALQATPESVEEEDKKDRIADADDMFEAAQRQKRDADEAKDSDPVATALNKAAIEVAAGEPEPKGDMKTGAPPTAPTKIEDKKAEIAKVTAEIKRREAEKAKQQEADEAEVELPDELKEALGATPESVEKKDRRSARREKLKGAFKSVFGSKDDEPEDTESGEPQDPVQTEGQAKVKSTPIVPGINTEPPTTPKPSESSGFTSEDVARAKASNEMRELLRSSGDQTEGAVQ
jgi:hypothetical protein